MSGFEEKYRKRNSTEVAASPGAMGVLPAYRLGKYWRFRAEEVLAWVQRHGEEGQAV